MTAPFFARFASAASGIAHAVYAQPAVLVPMQASSAKGPNSAREIDPSRPVTECSVIRSEAPARFEVADNGVGRNPGMMRTANSSVLGMVTFPEDLGVTPRKGDEIEFRDRPGIAYALGEPMPGNVPGTSFVFHRAMGRG